VLDVVEEAASLCPISERQTNMWMRRKRHHEKIPRGRHRETPQKSGKQRAYHEKIVHPLLVGEEMA
jgi:hypothetical protein